MTTEELQNEVTTLRRERLLYEVADVAGVKPTVLKALDRADLAYEIKDDNGKKTVMVKAGSGAATEFDTFAGANWADFMPALKPEQKIRGTPFVKQSAGQNARPVPSLKDQVVNAVLSKYKARK